MGDMEMLEEKIEFYKKDISNLYRFINDLTKETKIPSKQNVSIKNFVDKLKEKIFGFLRNGQ
jgi:hypothetical protein